MCPGRFSCKHTKNNVYVQYFSPKHCVKSCHVKCVERFSLLAKTLTKEVFKRHKILLHSATGGQKKHKFSRVCSLKKKG